MQSLNKSNINKVKPPCLSFLIVKLSKVVGRQRYAMLVLTGLVGRSCERSMYKGPGTDLVQRTCPVHVL